MRMEKYLTNTDYSLWQVILNGDDPIQVTIDENGVETEVPPKTFKHIQRQKERKLKAFALTIPMSITENVAFLSTEDTSSSNEVNTANGVSTALGHNSLGQASSSSYTDDLMEMYEHQEIKRNMKGDACIGEGQHQKDCTSGDHDALGFSRQCFDCQNRLGYDWSYIAQEEPTEFSLMAYTSNSSVSDTEYNLVLKTLGLESVEAHLSIHQKNEAVYEEKIAVLEFEVKDKDKTGLGYGDQLNESDSEVINSIFDSRSSDGDDNQTNDRFKKGNEYHAVPSPLTRSYMPPLADLSFAGLDDYIYRPTTNKTSASVSQVETSNTPPSNTSVEMPRSEDSQTTVKPSFKKIEFTKARNEPVKSDKQAVKPRMVTQSPKVDRKDWNGKMTQKLGLGFGFTKKACFVCGSYSHLIKDCDFHEKRMAKKSVLQILTRSGRIPVSTAKQVSKEKVNTVRVNGVNTAGQTAVSTVKGNGVTAVKASAGCGNPQQALKYKGMFDSGCSRHMTGNKALLTDYQDIDGGFVAFGGSTRGGKITGIGKIRTNKIDFEDVFFVKELKFNLFSVSQMCDKKNSVLFTETECLVLSPDFKLIDESQVLLRVPRQNNMYIGSILNRIS
ncbi:hypothetical protein Tco_0936642 [Tanacetum coccineum]|uniref:Retrovirus-related Pol polyprotein from transposon TNT 1-94-like beta-barrel domain-containing protein n=1 Tax=Tanacetum coccineum TaxID=301880 RepID=A0ABQ5DCX8_9ASTR